MNIERRGMDIDTRCPICSRLNEDGGHCFLKCKFVKKCWRAINLEEICLYLVDLNSGKQVASKILFWMMTGNLLWLVFYGHGGMHEIT
jgi:hypothetical protein